MSLPSTTVRLSMPCTLTMARTLVWTSAEEVFKVR